MSEKNKREKIGQGYWQNGYGKGFSKKPIIWLINGKAYAKDSRNSQYHVSIPGYIMVNAMKMDGKIIFAENGIISEHEDYKF